MDSYAAMDFAQRAEGVGSLNELTRRARLALAPFGVTCLSANMISAPGRIVQPGILFGQRWREWSRVYQRSGFARFDPALRMLQERTRPFTWGEAGSRFKSAEGERVVQACLSFTGCREGLVVPVRESDGALLTAAFSGPELALSAEARAAMHLIGHYYVTRGRELLLDVQLNPLCPLTPRQLACLEWVLRGKSDREIGTILTISPHTVHNHVEAAKAILGFGKRGQAALEAWRSGWIG